MRHPMIAALLGATVVASPAAAQTRGGFDIGLNAIDYDYRERLDDRTIVRDEGGMYGLVVAYTETLRDGWFVRIAAEAVTGNIDYRDDTGDRIDNVAQTVGGAEIHAGRDFGVGGGSTITPFLGIGRRSLEDESGGEVSTTGAFGYDREVVYRYVPVGMVASLPLHGRSRLLIGGQLNWIFSGRVDSKFSTADPELPDVRVRLRGGEGVRISALAELPLGRRAVRVGPMIEHWRVRRSQSTIVTDEEGAVEFFEPASRTTRMGVVVNFAF